MQSAPRFLARLAEDVRAKVPAPGVPLERVERLPDGTVSLLMRVTAGGQGDIVVTGPRSRALFKTVQPVPLVLGIRFRPGMASSFLGVPVDELTDRIVRLEELWGGEAVRLRDRLLAQGGVEAMVSVLSESLELRVRQSPEPSSARLVRRAMRVLAEPSGAGSPCIPTAARGLDAPWRVEDLAARLGVTSRHLRRAFLASVGIGPREFGRVMRFQRALRAAASGLSWTEVASIAGYYDQAHLNAHFRELTGATPSAFVARARGHRW